jgi:hypothetical protein
MKNRIPKDIKIEIGKNYTITYKRTEYKYVYEKSLNWYSKSCSVNKKQNDISYIIEKDLKQSINYVLSFAGNKFKIEEK